MPPVCSHRAPFAEKMLSQSKSSGWLFAIAVWPRSEQPTAARTPKPSFCEVQPIAYRSADAIVWNPADERSVHATLQDEILQKLANWISGKRRYHRGAHAKAPAKPASYVIFASTLPHAEITSGMYALLSGIEPEHHFAEAYAIPSTTVGRFQADRFHAQHSSCFENALFVLTV